MFVCGFCKEEYLLYSRLCPKCDKMYKLGVIYGFDKLNEIIDRCLIIPDENREKKLERCIKQVGNKNEVKE
tara:strand:- start:820 stop:1032 length:213 start_codon:yes stop_codon:yes gene_type:complete